jgi:branched-chain amino acid transport system substrate-binding protein
MDPNGFAGVNGIFRFNGDGTSERGLAVLEMTGSGPVVVSPAPTTFQRSGA